MDLVGIPRPAAIGEVLQLGLQLGEHVGIYQLPQLRLAEQLIEQVAIERQRLRLALGERRVLLIDVRRDIGEHQ